MIRYFATFQDTQNIQSGSNNHKWEIVISSFLTSILFYTQDMQNIKLLRTFLFHHILLDWTHIVDLQRRVRKCKRCGHVTNKLWNNALFLYIYICILYIVDIYNYWITTVFLLISFQTPFLMYIHRNKHALSSLSFSITIFFLKNSLVF